MCLAVYLIVERECLDQGCTWRQLKHCLILKDVQAIDSIPSVPEGI